MNETKNQHVLGVALLEVLGLDSIRIRREGNNYSFVAWTEPADKRHNGSGRTTRRGVLTVK